ncbi:MAG: EscU/YscU/HrcU family type III secretion system export apparatus switch protein [Planctomycetota bacterium]
MTDESNAPRHAVALRYDADAGERAPEVVAKGRGEVARNILETAAAAGVPIREDADLLELLSIVEVGDEIPVEVYAAVAQLVSFLWSLNEERLAGGR